MVNPSKCEAFLYTLSTHTDENKDDSPLIYERTAIPVSIFGTQDKLPKLLGMQLDARAT